MRMWRHLGLVLILRAHYSDAETERDHERQHLDHHDGGDDADHHPDVVLEELHQRVSAALPDRRDHVRQHRYLTTMMGNWEVLSDG